LLIIAQEEEIATMDMCKLYKNLISRYLYLSPFQTEVTLIAEDRGLESIRLEFAFNSSNAAEIVRDGIVRQEPIAVRIDFPHGKIQTLKGYETTGVQLNGETLAAWIFVRR
jgi:hypothetical protein